MVVQADNELMYEVNMQGHYELDELELHELVVSIYAMLILTDIK